MKRFYVVSIFPELFTTFKQIGMIERAISKELITLETVNPRDFTKTKYKAVDDKPYGGGPGMVMTPEIMTKAIIKAKQDLKNVKGNSKVVYLSPQGIKLTQSKISDEINSIDSFVFIAGRYEGIDERVIDNYIDEEWSIGDYILTGGEVPAMVAIEAMTRLISGVLNTNESATNDSFTMGLLDYPSYTKPIDFEGNLVPEVLLSGDHKKIFRWRKKQSLGRTWERRPDILDQYNLTEEEQILLEEYKLEL